MQLQHRGLAPRAARSVSSPRPAPAAWAGAGLLPQPARRDVAVGARTMKRRTLRKTDVDSGDDEIEEAALLLEGSSTTGKSEQEVRV